MARGSADWTRVTASISHNEQGILPTTTGTSTINVPIPNDANYHAAAISVTGIVDAGTYYGQVTITGNKTNFHMFQETVGAGATNQGFFSPVIVVPISTLDTELICTLFSNIVQNTALIINFDFYSDSIPPSLSVSDRIAKGLFMQQNAGNALLVPVLQHEVLGLTITQMLAPATNLRWIPINNYVLGTSPALFSVGVNELMRRVWVENLNAGSARVSLLPGNANGQMYANLAPSGSAGSMDRNLLPPGGYAPPIALAYTFNSDLAGNYQVGLDV